MNKHAYLIMAHDDPGLLETLIKLIDAPYNDIYLHIDIKAKLDLEQIKLWVNESKLCLIERMDVRWGDYTQTECEIRLLSEAVKTPHSYYHLLSGHDLPIKHRKEIYDFFEQNAGVEYIAYNRPQISDGALGGIIRYRGVFKNSRLEHYSQMIQNKLKIDRRKKHDLTYMKGSNWFSITHELAEYVVANKALCKKVFRFTRNSDEVFLQTLAYNSDFKKRLCTDFCDLNYRVLESDKAMANYRTMDWPDELGDAHPKVLTLSDLPALKKSKAFWARKFDSRTDSEIIRELYHMFQ